MLHRSRRIRDDHIGEGMRPALIAEQQAVALTIVTRIDGVRTHLHESAVRILAMTGGDSFRYNTRARVLSDMNHLRARIGLLVVVRHCLSPRRIQEGYFHVMAEPVSTCVHDSRAFS